MILPKIRIFSIEPLEELCFGWLVRTLSSGFSFVTDASFSTDVRHCYCHTLATLLTCASTDSRRSLRCFRWSINLPVRYSRSLLMHSSTDCRAQYRRRHRSHVRDCRNARHRQRRAIRQFQRSANALRIGGRLYLPTHHQSRSILHCPNRWSCVISPTLKRISADSCVSSALPRRSRLCEASVRSIWSGVEQSTIYSAQFQAAVDSTPWPTPPKSYAFRLTPS